MKLNSHLSMLMAARILSAIMQALILILIARNVEIAEFGFYSAALALGAIVLGLLSFGLPTRVLILAKEREGFIPASIAITCIAAGIAGVGVSWLGSIITGSVSWWVVSAGTYIGSEMITNLTQNILFGSSRLKSAEITIVARRAIPLFLVGGGALWSPELIFQAASIGYILTALFSVAIVGLWKWTGWHLGAVLGGSIQYWLTSLWSMLQQLDVLIITALVGPSAAGAYSAAFRLASPVHIVTSSMVSILLPRLSGINNFQGRNSLGWRFQKLGLGYTFILIVGSPLAWFVGPYLFGDQFKGYGFVFSLLIVNSAVSVYNQLQIARYYAEDLASLVSRLSAISTLSGLCLIVVGSYYFGLFGAALGTISIQILLCGSLAIYWKAYRKKRKEDKFE